MMNYLIKAFITYKLVIFISLIIGFIIALPYIYGYYTFNNNFSPLISNDNLSYLREHTYSYSAQVNQIIKGHLYGDAYIWEYKSNPSPFVGELASIIPIAIISLLANSVPNGFILSSFAFSLILFVLIYTGLRIFNFPRYFNLFAATSIIIIPFLSSLLPYYSHNLTQITGGTLLPLFFFRIPNPLISSIYLFLSIFSTIFILKNPSAKYFYLWPVIVGVSIYSSTFIMSTVLFALVLLAPKLFSKISKQKLIISFLIIFLIAIPYLINFISANIIFNTKEFLLTFTFEPKIMFPVQIRYILIALLLLWARKKDAFSKVILAFVLSAAILMEFHQVIIGRNIQADHYISRILAPIATLSIFIILYEKLDFLKRNIKIWIIFTVVVLTIGFHQQLSWINRYPNDFEQLTYRKNLIDYINKNTDKNDVIGTLDPDINDEIQANTGRWVYMAPGDRTFVSHSEQLTRICDLSTLSGLQTNNPKSRRAILYSLAFAGEDENKVNQSLKKVNNCIENNKEAPRYKLNYLIDYDNVSENWKLLKIQ